MGQSQSSCYNPNVYEEKYHTQVASYPQPPPPQVQYYHVPAPVSVPVVPHYQVQYHYPQPVFPVTFRY